MGEIEILRLSKFWDWDYYSWSQFESLLRLKLTLDLNLRLKLSLNLNLRVNRDWNSVSFSKTSKILGKISRILENSQKFLKISRFSGRNFNFEIENLELYSWSHFKSQMKLIFSRDLNSKVNRDWNSLSISKILISIRESQFSRWRLSIPPMHNPSEICKISGWDWF